MPRRSANEMSFLNLPSSTSAGSDQEQYHRAVLLLIRQTRVAHMLGEEEVPMVHRRKALMVEEAPCPPVVSRAKGEKVDPDP